MGSKQSRQFCTQQLDLTATVVLDHFLAENVQSNPDWWWRIVESSLCPEIISWFRGGDVEIHLARWARSLKDKLYDLMCPNLGRFEKMMRSIRVIESCGISRWSRDTINLLDSIQEILTDLAVGFELQSSTLNLVSFRSWADWTLLHAMGHFILFESGLLDFQYLAILIHKCRSQLHRLRLSLARNLLDNLAVIPEKSTKSNLSIRIIQRKPVVWISKRYGLKDAVPLKDTVAWNKDILDRVLDCVPGNCDGANCLKGRFVSVLLSSLFDQFGTSLDCLLRCAQT